MPHDFVDDKADKAPTHSDDNASIVLLVPIDGRVVKVIALLVFAVSWLLFDRLFGE